MHKHISILAVIALAMALSGCSEKDNNPTDTAIYGIKLEQFIDPVQVTDSLDAEAADTLDFRSLFAYEIVSGDDGFSPRQSSYAGYDLNWSAFKEGFLVPSENYTTWFSDPLLPGAFRVKLTGYFRLFRKIDVVAADNSTKMVELGGLPAHTVTNWDGNPEQAVKLSDLLQGITAYDSVSLVCYDDYGSDKYYHPDAIDDGYYLLTTERTIFPTANIANNMKKLKKVSYVKVYGPAAEQAHEFELAPISGADIIFTVPADLSDYEQTELTGYPN